VIQTEIVYIVLETMIKGFFTATTSHLTTKWNESLYVVRVRVKDFVKIYTELNYSIFCSIVFRSITEHYTGKLQLTSSHNFA